METLGQLPEVIGHARQLLHPVPSVHHWTPYLGETLDSGMATLLAAEIIEAIRFIYGLQPEPMPGFHLAGGTSFTSPDAGVGGGDDGGHLNGPIDDIQLRSWGIQLVDGRMPGFAAIVGAAKSNEVAVKIVRELQRRNILTFLSGNVNGRSIIHQLTEEGVELGYDTYTVPFGTDTLSAIYALGFATRSALTFGGMKGGMARDILLYNRDRVFAFVLALGEVDDLKYAAAAGAINFGFPVIADTVIPEILPTGVTTYEHVVSMPFNEIEGADDLERAERLVQKCIEVRGVKVKVADVPVPVPYGSAFEGEVVRKADMRVEFGGKNSRCFEYLHMAALDEVVDGKVEVVGPTFDDIEPGGYMDMGIVVSVAGRQMQEDFEPVLERQIHYFVNGASGIQHIGQRDIAWIRISNNAADKGFNLEHFGKILHARFHADFGAIVDKVQVTIYTDPEPFAEWLEKARAGLRLPQQAPGRPDRRARWTSSTPARCASPSRRTTSASSARSGWACAARTTGWTARRPSASTPPAPTSRSSSARCSTPDQRLLDRHQRLCAGRLARRGREVAMYSIMENPMTACGCFECIVMLIPEANGVMVVSREDHQHDAGRYDLQHAGRHGGRWPADPRRDGCRQVLPDQPEVHLRRWRLQAHRLDEQLPEGVDGRRAEGRCRARRRPGPDRPHRRRARRDHGRRAVGLAGRAQPPGAGHGPDLLDADLRRGTACRAPAPCDERCTHDHRQRGAPRLVRDLMTVGVVTCPPRLTLMELARLFLEKDAEGVIVLDEEGHASGVVSQDEMVRAYAHPAAETLTAEDIMRDDIPEVPPDIPLHAAAQIMHDMGVRAVYSMHHAGGIAYPSAIDLVPAYPAPSGRCKPTTN